MIDSQSAVEKYFKDGFSSKSNEIKCNFKYTKKILDIRDRIQIIEMVVPVCNYKDLIVEGSSVSCSKSTGKSGTIENDLERTMLAFEKEKKVFTIEIYCGKKL